MKFFLFLSLLLRNAFHVYLALMCHVMLQCQTSRYRFRIQAGHLEQTGVKHSVILYYSASNAHFQGAFVKNWKTRYFVLRPGDLSYFKVHRT